MKIKNLFMVACTACLLFACKCSSKSGETASAEKLSAETVWGLQSIRNKKVSFAEEGRMAYIQFNPEAKSVNGCAGCNRFFGSYEEPKDGQLVLSEMGATKMACPDNEMAIEDMFLSNLGKVNAYRIDGDKLELLQNDKVIMTFEKTSLPEE